MPGNSAAWVLAIVSVVAGLMGSLLLTVLDPMMQAFFDSGFFTGSTSYSQNFLGYYQDAWVIFPALILIGIMTFVWIETRQPT